MTITQLTEKAIAVTGLPQGATGFCIETGCLFTGPSSNNDWDLHGRIELPEGNWTILGRAAELTESQKAEYEPLLKAKGLYVTNPLSSEKPVTVIGHKGQEIVCELILERFQEQWQSAEELTNPLILIK